MEDLPGYLFFPGGFTSRNPLTSAPASNPDSEERGRLSRTPMMRLGEKGTGTGWLGAFGK